MSTKMPIFKCEPRPGGYTWVITPEFPGFSAMLEPGESVGDDHIRALLMLVALDSQAAERRACADIARAIDSGRGNEKEIAKAILARDGVMR